MLIGRSTQMALVVGLCLAVFVAVAPSARAITLTAFSPSGIFFEEAVAQGPDGNLWITSEISTVARVDPAGRVLNLFRLDDVFAKAYGITAGPRDSMWFVEERSTPMAGSYIGRIGMNGVTEHFPLLPSADPRGITAGPDGQVWFTESGRNRIARITSSGEVTEFDGLRAGAKPGQITVGADGNLWFTEGGAAYIGRITPRGGVTEFPIGDIAGGIASGPDGSIWFTTRPTVFPTISRMSLSGIVTGEFRALSGSGPGPITAGPDGNMWFGEATGRVGRVTPSGRITEYSEPSMVSGNILDISPGPGATLWYVDLESKYGRVDLDMPLIATGATSDVQRESGTLTGSAQPRGSNVTAHFEYGTTTEYGATTAARAVGDGDDAVALSETLTGLAPATTYHYRLVGSSPLGTFRGDDQVFTTVSIPEAPPPADDDQDGYPVTVDCNDRDPRVRPGATDTPRDGIDQDCSGADAPYATLLGTTISATFVSRRRYTAFRSLVVLNARAGTAIEIRCTGPGCRSATRRRSVAGDRARINLLPLVRAVRMSRRTVIEIRLTRPVTVGLVTRWKGRDPTRSNLCLSPDPRSKPASCSKVRP